MQNTKFYAALLVWVIFAGIFSLSPAISSLMNGVVVRSTGEVLTGAHARSGSARDIQAAVDLVAEHGGIGNVYIPEGTFNFVEVGEPWMTVNIPAGVNLFGAPTERDANGQVIEWKTVLVMPWEVPTGATWFAVQLGDGSESFRFSDIKLVGWRFYNSSSTTMYTGVKIYLSQYASYPTEGIQNFRVDHCHFQDIAGSALSVGPNVAEWNRRVISGVIDHCRLVNTYGDPGLMAYKNATLGYGISMRRWASDVWDYNTFGNVIGHYTNYTIFIENNYFSKWRHDVSSNDGIHYVFRYNIDEGGYGIGSVDGHGSYADSYHPYAVGTRATEVYNNTFKDPDKTWWSMPWAINIRGGSVLAFNNTLIGYYALCDLNNDWGNYEPYSPQCHINQTYIWNNNLGGARLIKYNSDNTENVHYFLRAPNLTQDGFEYKPYLYPHPLALEATP